MKTKNLNKKKKKIWKYTGEDKIQAIKEYRINDRGELVLVKSQNFEYDGMDIMFARTDYLESDYE